MGTRPKNETSDAYPWTDIDDKINALKSLKTFETEGKKKTTTGEIWFAQCFKKLASDALKEQWTADQYTWLGNVINYSYGKYENAPDATDLQTRITERYKTSMLAGPENTNTRKYLTRFFSDNADTILEIRRLLEGMQSYTLSIKIRKFLFEDQCWLTNYDENRIAGEIEALNTSASDTVKYINDNPDDFFGHSKKRKEVEDLLDSLMCE